MLHRSQAFVVIALLGLLSGDMSGSGRSPAKQAQSRARSTVQSAGDAGGLILVRFKRNAPASERIVANETAGAQALRTFEFVEGLQLVRLQPGVSVHEALDQYRRHPDVLYAEPNHVISSAAAMPNDPQFPSQWGLHNTGQSGGVADADIDAPEAWEIQTGSSAVVVAVLDTGIDYAHPDLAQNMFQNTADCNANGVDDDGNGRIDDCYGIDTLNNDSDPMDDDGHGTRVAGTIGAAGNNGIGVAGVNWHVQLLPCKFMNENGIGSIAGAIACLDYVKKLKDRGVNIVATNNSWRLREYSQALSDAIDEQRQSGILFIAAAGNDTSSNDTLALYPASFYLPNVIAVAATSRSDGLTNISNVGRRTVHLGAPGQDILSTAPGDTYETDNGTSMSAPFVTGVAALLKAQDQNRDWRAIRNLILAGGDPVPALVGNTVTGRRLNAHGALTCAGATVQAPLLPVGKTASFGVPITLAALHINCAAPNGNVSVTINPGGSTVTLLDNGADADQEAGDGVYSGQWMPPATGTYTLTFPNSDVTTVTVLSPYTSSSTTYSYRTIADDHPLRLEDSTSKSIPAPFDIMFGGQSFTTLFISDNGNINFTRPFVVDGDKTSEPLATPRIDTLVAPFWDDLVPRLDTDRNVFWDVQGVTPNRELVIEWRNLEHRDCAETAVTFQVVFFEGQSSVLFNYADATFGASCAADHGGTATVGIQTSRDTASSFSVQTPNMADGTARLWTTASSAQVVTVGFTAPSSAVAEAGGLASITATLTTSDGGATAAAGSVSYATSAGTAAASGDYTTIAGTLSWLGGLPSGTTFTINVPVTNDTLSEANESFVVTLKTPVGALVGSSAHTVTILDNDPLPLLTINDVVSTEGNIGTKAITFTVSLLAPSGQEVRVAYETANGTATAPGDYVSISGLLVFPPGTTSLPISVFVNGDTTPEPAETFSVILSAPVSAVIFRAAGEGRILDDEPKIAFTSTRDGNDEIYVMNADGTGQINLTNNPAADGGPSWSPDGTRIAFSSNRSGAHQIYVMNADGTQVINCTQSTVDSLRPAWSPDGTKILFNRYGNADANDNDVYVMNAADCGVPGAPAPVGLATNHSNPNRDEEAAPSPDGTRIVFVRSSDFDDHRLFIMNADGTGQAALQPNILPINATSPAWSPDGVRIAFNGVNPGQPYRIYVLNANGSGGLTPLTPAEVSSTAPSFSPDGSQIAFETRRDGNSEIYVMNADGTLPPLPNRSNHPGHDTDPAWQPVSPSNPPPAIATQPSSQTITSGQTATMTVIAAGTGPLTYQWFGGGSGNITSPIAGATGSSYTTPALTSTTSYWVRVSNDFGIANSNTATISIGTAPTITTQPKSRTILSNQTATLTVLAAGTAPLAYQWYVGPSGNLTSPVAGATASSYTTPALTSETTYWVRVSNPYGSADSAAATIVIGTFAAGRIAFTSSRGGNPDVFVMNADGTSPINLTNHPADDAAPAWSPDGTKIAFTTTRSGVHQIYVMNADGTAQTNCTQSAITSTGPAWSPDGTKILFTRYGNPDPTDNDVYVMNAADCGVSPVAAPIALAATHPTREEEAAWSPDGTRIVYVHSTFFADHRLYTMNANGTGQAPLLPSILPLNPTSPTWSPDGIWITFTGTVPGIQSQVYRIKADGTGGLTSLTTPANFNGMSPSFAPDSSKIGFVSSRDGNTEIYLMEADGSGQRNLTGHSAADAEPDWQRLMPPTITTQSASQTVAAGQTATVTVVATGTATLTYQWYEGSSGTTTNPIGGATASSYTTPALTDAKSYWVRVSNTYGVANSDTAVISIGAAPLITDVTRQPPSQPICSGQTVTITVVASGAAPSSYQWYLGQTGLTTNPIAGATASSYTTPPLTGSASYWVRVSNPFGSADSNTIAISVSMTPTIATQPQGQMIAAGQPVTIGMAATNPAGLTYQWYRGASGNTATPIAGATGSSYATTAPANTTSYWVRVSNGCGQVNSATATISVPLIEITGPKGGSGEASTDKVAPLTVVWQGVSQPTATDSFALYALGAADGESLKSWSTGGTRTDSFIVPLPDSLPTGTYELRLFGQNHQRLAVSKPFTVTGPALTLSVSPRIVEAGGALTVTWHDIPTPSPTDWIGLFPAGGADTGSVTRLYTSGAAGGSVLMPASVSLTPGSYEVRLFANDGYELLAISQIVTVTGPGFINQTPDGIVTQATRAPVLVASPPSVVMGGTLTVTWKNVVSDPATFAIVRTDLPDSEFVNGSSHSTSGALNGEMLVQLPPGVSPGLYELRLFGGAGTDGPRLVKSNAFTSVSLDSVPAIATPPANQTIAPGQSAMLSVAATGAPPLTYQWYQGTSPNTNTPIAGATGSSYTTPALANTTSYWVRVSNVYPPAADSTTATIAIATLAIAPPLPSQPTCAGGTATLSVVATGTAPFTYRWYQGPSGNTSSPIAGATASSYATPALTATTSYWVRVSNGHLVADSAAIVVVVRTPPAITAPPGSQTIGSNQAATLTVAATGTAPLAYQWYQGPSGNTSAPIAGATSSSITTPALTATTSYWVRVTNACAPPADSAAATITIGSPAITTQPSSQTIGSGQTAMLSVAATGAPPLTYQWYQGTSPNLSTPIAGATGSSYTTPALANTTSYWVRVSNAYAPAVDSTTATIAIAALDIAPALPSQPICAGDTATLSVVATGTAPFTYQWYQGPSGNTSSPIAGATASSYATPALTTTTTYWVRVSNGYLVADSAAIVVVVRTPPAITTPPDNQTIGSSQAATLTVAATGTAPLAYQWYQGPSGNTSVPIAGATSSSMTTPALTATTSYWVRVSNACAPPADSAAATITIGSPAITTQPSSQPICAGATATLSVVATGTAPFTYQWYQGPSGNTSSPIAGATASSYATPALTATTTYWVRVSNGYLVTDSAAIVVVVRTPPAITTPPGSQTIGSSQAATLTVAATGTAPLAYQWYQGPRGNTSAPIAGATSSSMTTPALTATTSYWVRVSNACAPPADSAAATITIGSPAITTQPSSQTIGSGQTAMLSVASTGAPPLTYQWYQGPSPNTSSPIAGATESSYTTPALTSTTSYWVQVSNAYLPVANSVPATITIAPLPTLTLTPSVINLTVVIDDAGNVLSQTPPQTLRLTKSGLGAVTWTAAVAEPSGSPASWVTLTPASTEAGSGELTLAVNSTSDALHASGQRTATLTIDASGAADRPAATVNLNVILRSANTPPFGVIETPTDGLANVTGSLGVTGWALDDVGIAAVRICRRPVAGEVALPADHCNKQKEIYIGDAVLVNGARPDVESLPGYSTYPMKDQAGWGYLLLTNFLPDNGNGDFTLTVYAVSIDGQTTQIGSPTIRCTNATATQPFGAIDTPAQGATISGPAYINFGWALTPQPKAIPIDGSTIAIFIDGHRIGTLDSYNNRRADIQNAFPGYVNTDGAVGFKTLDSTTLTNGVHTIAWVVIDNQGAAAGIGSRFFTVANGSSALSPAVSAPGSRQKAVGIIDARPRALTSAAAVDQIASSPSAVPVTHGYGADARPEWALPDHLGLRRVRTAQLELVTIELNTAADGDDTRYRGYTRDGETLRALPIGSHLDERTGAFAWAPGLAFGGGHDLVFVKTWAHGSERIDVRVDIDAQTTPAGDPRLVIDMPGSGASLAQPFTIAGWAVDPSGPANGPGIDALHVWAYPLAGGDPKWVGVAGYGGVRADVADLFGPRFGRSGYTIDVAGLPSGAYDIVVYARSLASGRFAIARTVRVTVN